MLGSEVSRALFNTPIGRKVEPKIEGGTILFEPLVFPTIDSFVILIVQEGQFL